MMKIEKTSKFLYECSDCGKQYTPNGIHYLCPVCAATNTTALPPKGVLKLIYPWDDIKKKYPDFNDLKTSGFQAILPVKSMESFSYLNIGKTPLYRTNTIDNHDLPFTIFLKDDAQNPSFSFKDRASSLVSAFAKENNINTIVAASTGNAGSSLACICAAQKQNAIILVPESAPLAKLTQILMYGARIVPVKGTYDDAFDLSIAATEAFQWYNRNTAFNPLTIEGKKTAALELFDQMGSKFPDRIYVPCGDGVIISGIYKGFEDLFTLGYLQKMPKIIAVQSDKSDNLVRNLTKSTFTIKAASTIADSISVDIPRNYHMAAGFLKKYDGEGLLVTDHEIMEASALLSKNTGLFAEPAAATAFAGLWKHHRSGSIPEGSNNIVMLTGSGLKDLRAVQSLLDMPQAIEPDIKHLKNIGL